MPPKMLLRLWPFSKASRLASSCRFPLQKFVHYCCRDVAHRVCIFTSRYIRAPDLLRVVFAPLIFATPASVLPSDWRLIQVCGNREGNVGGTWVKRVGGGVETLPPLPNTPSHTWMTNDHQRSGHCELLTNVANPLRL